MRISLLTSRTVLLLTCAALVLGADGRPARAAVCHDGSWEAGEFCGRDAWLVTGKTEMNHDCPVDILDLGLWLAEFALAGPNLSGDINGNGLVDLADFMFLVPSFGTRARPCTPSGMLPDVAQGTIALSFSSNPNTIDSTRTQAPGPGSVYVVVDGWTNPWTVEYAVEASSNVAILSHPETTYPHWETEGIPVTCDPDSRHSWRGFVRTSSGTWPSGPIIYNQLTYQVYDENPAWLKLVPVPSCFANSRIRWAQLAANRSFDFATVLNAGINGPAPPGESTYSPKLPALSPHMMWLLAALLPALAVTFLGRRSLRRVHDRG